MFRFALSHLIPFLDDSAKAPVVPEKHPAPLRQRKITVSVRHALEHRVVEMPTEGL